MKKNTNATRLRHTLTFCLMLAVFSTYTMTASALPENKSLMGELIVSGHNVNGNEVLATINGERAYSGRTFFSSGAIATSDNTSATVKLGKLGYINLTPNSNLSLSFSENKISGMLSAGQIKVFNNDGVEVNIQTADSLVSNEAQQKGVFTIDVRAGMTKTASENGLVYVNNGKTVVPVKAAQDDKNDTDGNSPLVPIIVFSAIVAVAVIYVVTKNGNDDRAFISPRR
ncbi:MAG: hypothetical protein ACR2MG_12010 [Pyrinomonadaceae bacterium]